MNRVKAATLALVLTATIAVADSSLDGLSSMVTPAGSDLFYCVQSSTDYKCTLDQIRAWSAVAITGGTATGITLDNSAIGSSTASTIKGTTINATTSAYVGGVGTAVNKLGVAGGAAIGAGYAGSSAAPSNGLLVQGYVGIGTTTTTFPLMVRLDGSGGQNTLSLYNNTAAAANVGSRILFTGVTGTQMTYLQGAWEGASTDNGYLAIYTRGSAAAGERVRIASDGKVGVGTTSPTELLDVNSSTIRIRTAKTPASAADTCDQGEIAWDTSYIYICIATNTWQRAAHATW